MTQCPWGVCARPVSWTSRSLFEQNVLIRVASRLWPGFWKGHTSSPHHADGGPRWATTRCATGGGVNPMSRTERRSSPRPEEDRHRGGAEIPNVHGRILLVDDDVAVLEVLTEGIRGHGYLVDVAAGGVEALGPLTDRPYDLVITDIAMPGLDGWQLIAAAIHQQPMVRVIVMTGRDEPEDRERAAALGVPLFRKPFSLAALQRAIDDALASHD
jgi:CheY-like chemotaxis protein